MEYVGSIWFLCGFYLGSDWFPIWCLWFYLVSTFDGSIYVGSIVYISGFYKWSLHGLVS